MGANPRREVRQLRRERIRRRRRRRRLESTPECPPQRRAIPRRRHARGRRDTPRGHTQTKRHEPGRRTPPRCGRVECSLAVPVPIPVPARVPGSVPAGVPGCVLPDAERVPGCVLVVVRRPRRTRESFGSTRSVRVSDVSGGGEYRRPIERTVVLERERVPDDEIARVAVVASSRVVGRDGVVGHGESVREET